MIIIHAGNQDPGAGTRADSEGSPYAAPGCTPAGWHICRLVSCLNNSTFSLLTQRQKSA